MEMKRLEAVKAIVRASQRGMIEEAIWWGLIDHAFAEANDAGGGLDVGR